MKLYFSPVGNSGLNESYARVEEGIARELYHGADKPVSQTGDFNSSRCPTQIMLTSPTVEKGNVVFSGGRTIPLSTVVEIAAQHALKVHVAPDTVSIP